MKRFTPEDRQAVLDRLLAELIADARLTGVLIVGSGAVGFEDAYSDLDLAAVVASADEVESTWRDWRARIETLFPVIGCSSMPRGPNVFLHAFLLGGFLELDISFQHIDDLFARRQRWRVAFDRSGRIETVMQESWAKRPAPDIEGVYRRYMVGIWYYIIHVMIAVQRGQAWRALYDLEEIRARTIILAGLRLGMETEHYRDADRLPPGLLAALEETLVKTTEPDEIKRALRVAAVCFFREARALDAMLGLTLADRLETPMQTYLDLW
jgi:hypothetical protein